MDRRQSVRRQPARRRRAARGPTARASTCATSARPSSCSARGATTSRRRSRRSAGSPIFTTDDDEIVANGQTIVYTMHQSIGHLGIFVSGKVATKEHGEFASCMDMIDLMPPGLYEAVITEVGEDTANPRTGPRPLPVPPGDAQPGRYPRARRQRRRGRSALRHGRARFRGQPRRCTAPRLAPAVRAMATEQSAEAMRKTASRTACGSPCSPTRIR